MRVRLNTGLMVIAFVVLSSWPALTVLSPSAPGSTATPGNFGLLKPREDKFLNYDVGCENDACRPSDCGDRGCARGSNVDWAVDLLFWNNASKDIINNGDVGLGFYFPFSGGKEHFKLNDGGNKGWQWDFNHGLKSQVVANKDTHFRIYAKPNAPGRMFNLAYGFYVVGTAHHDVNEQRPGEYFGESEQAEYEVGLTAADVWGPAKVSPDPTSTTRRCRPRRRARIAGGTTGNPRESRFRTIPRFFAVVLGCGLWLGLAAAQASAGELGETDPAARIPVGGVDLPVSGEREGRTIAIDLPPGASQGHPDWYLIRFHVALTVSDNSRPGVVYLTASINGRTAGQIRVAIRRTVGCKSLLRWSTVDAVDGVRRGGSCGRTLQVIQTNFLQYGSVNPGRNNVRFGLETLGRPGLGGRRCCRTQVSSSVPAVRVVLPSAQQDRTRALNRTRHQLPYELRVIGNRPVQQVVVSAEPTSRQLRGRSAHGPGRAGRGGRRGSFRMRASAPGTFRQRDNATGPVNSPTAIVVVRVSPSRIRSSDAATGTGWGCIVRRTYPCWH